MNPYPAQIPAYNPLRYPFLGTMPHLPYPSHHHPALSPSQPNGHHQHSLLESVIAASSSDQKSAPHSLSLSRMSNGNSASSVGASSPPSAAVNASRSISSPGSESKSKLTLNGLGNHHLNNLSNNRLNHLNQSNCSNSSSGHHSNNNLRNIDDDSRSVSSNNSNNMSHVKKPLNAFMLYMKEQRPRVVNEFTLKESAAINQILGKQVPFQLQFFPL